MKAKKQTICGYPVEGEILDNGKCICAVCGKKGKMGGTINPHPKRQSVMVMCEQCVVRESATRHGTTIKEAKEQRKRMFAAQNLKNKIIIERYLKEAGKEEISDLEEANAVLHCGLEWWNEELSIDDRRRIELLSLEEQKKIFMEAEIDFSDLLKKPSAGGPKTGRNDPCTCGSGKKFKKCCLLKMH